MHQIRNKSNVICLNHADVFFTFVIIMFPILSVYGIGLGTFTFGDLLLCLSVVCVTIRSALFRNTKNNISLPFLLFAIYIGLNLLFNKAFSVVPSDVTARTVRYLFYVFVLSVYVPEHFNERLGNKIIIIASIASIIMMLIQTIGFQFGGKYIPGYIPGLPIIREELVSFSETGEINSLGLLRPRSFFGEPAHYCQFLLCTLCICLFNRTKKNLYLSIILIFGIIISISSTGILCLLFLLAIYFKNNWKKAIVFAPIIIIVLLLIYNTDFIQGFLIRMEDGKSTSDRFAGYHLLSELSNNIPALLFGQSMIQTFGDYLSGYMRLILYFGIVGTLIFLFAMFYRYFKVNYECKILIWLFIILNIGTEVALGPFLLVYLSFVLTNHEYRSRHLKLQ